MKVPFIAIGIGAVAVSLGLAGYKILKVRKEVHDEVAEALLKEKGELELYVDMIDSACREVPEEIMFAADRTFAELVDEAVDFTNSVFMPYGLIDEDSIDDYSDETLRAYLECIRGSIKMAKKYYGQIEEARDNMLKARDQLKEED